MKDRSSQFGDEMSQRPVGPTRDRLISAIYETVLRPDLYDSFMEIWEDHIQKYLDDADIAADDVGSNARLSDPILEEHFNRAYSILEQFGRTGAQSGVLQKVRDSGGLAVAYDANGTALAASASSASLFAEGDTLDSLEGLLTADATRLLRGLVRAAKDGISTGTPVVLATGGHPHHLVGRVVQAKGEDGRQTHMLLVEGLDFHWTERAEQLLADSFGLSPAEIEIVRNLLAGRTLRDIAQKSGRSEHTIRNQAKAVLSKTGAPGQVDLIRLVAFLLAEDGREQLRAPGFDHLPSEILRMQTGLSMQVFQAGSESGRPVLYVHGLTEGPAPIGLHDDWLRRHGIRMFCPARPGFGQSDPLPDPERALDLYVAHVSELIDRLGMKRPVLLGHMAGCLFACAIADRLGTKVAGVVAVSSSAPIAKLSQIGLMPPRQRVVAYTARFAPALLLTVVRAGIAQVESRDWGKFMDALYPPGTLDHQVIQRLNLADIIHSGYQFTVRNGPTGFATDSQHVVRDWRKLLTGSPFPAVFFCGEADEVVPVQSMRDTLGQRDGVDIREVPNSAQLILYEHPDLVFRAVAELGGWTL